MSDRLKSLRNQIDSDPSTSPGSGLHQSHSDAIPSSAPGASATQPQPSGTGGNAQVDHSVSRSPTAGGEREDVDLLLSTNEETLEDLLAELESDQTWLDAVAAEEEEKEEEEERHRRAIALLEELGGEPSTGNLKRGGDNDATTSRKAKRGSPEDHGDDDSDDDSEGDQMARETDDVLEKALDEAELEQNQRSAPETTSVDHPKGTPSSHHPAGPGGGTTFKLPTVPSQLQDQPTTTGDNDDDDDDDGDLSETDADFEASIAARMAALKVSSADNPILPSVPASEVDVNELGLPGAPTFSPHDRPVPGLFRKNTGPFTDEDQKSWCIVCLEDGAIRCLGCEDGDNVYCARCWKEMHVGPRAGYEERGHRWEKFVRGLR